MLAGDIITCVTEGCTNTVKHKTGPDQQREHPEAPDFTIVEAKYLNRHGLYLSRTCRIHQEATPGHANVAEDALARALAFRAHHQIKTTVKYLCGHPPTEGTLGPTKHTNDCPACAYATHKREQQRLVAALGARGPGSGECEICDRTDVPLVTPHAHLGPRPDWNPISLDGLRPTCSRCNVGCGHLNDDYKDGGLMHGLEEYGDELAKSNMEYFDSSPTLE